MVEEKIYWKLKEFGEWFQGEDVTVENAEEKYPNIKILEIELQNAFVYDHIDVEYKRKKFRITFNSDGYVMDVKELD